MKLFLPKREEAEEEIDQTVAMTTMTTMSQQCCRCHRYLFMSQQMRILLSVSGFRSRVPVGVEVMTGACVSMSLMKSLVILSNSSTSLILRGTPPPGTGTGPGGDGCAQKEGGPSKTLLFCGDSVNVKSCYVLQRLGEFSGVDYKSGETSPPWAEKLAQRRGGFGSHSSGRRMQNP